MKTFLKTCPLFLLSLGLQTRAAETLKYVLAPGSMIRPYDGPTPTGPAEPLTGWFSWVFYGYATGTVIGYDAAGLDFQSASYRLQLNRTPANDITSAVHTDSTLTVFDEVADISGLDIPIGYIRSESGGTYAGPATRPQILYYPNIGSGPLSAGRFYGRLDLVAVLEELVNVAPSFTKGPDITVYRNCGPQVITRWATDITAGPPNEATQTLDFVVTTERSALFSSPPALIPDGTLSFTPAPNASGAALVTVVLRDNGGTAYGGQDTSAAQTFTITVVGPVDLLEKLIAEVQQANLPHGTKTSLLATLNAAQRAFQRENWNNSAQQLSVFQNKVRLQVTPNYPDLARQWMAEAEAILEMLPHSGMRVRLAPALRLQAD